MKVWKKIWITLLCWQDKAKDKKICGRSLVEYQPISTEDVHASQPSHYRLLEQIFCKAKFTKDDSILDVGCGKGRILAFLTEKGYTCQISGVELNQEVAAVCKEWTKAYPNIQVIESNVLDLDLDQYTVLILFNPFGKNVLFKLLDKLENGLTHPIDLYYLSDYLYGNHIDGRPGWTLKHRGWVWKDGFYYLAYSPQRCSWWRYTPPTKEA